MFADPEGPIEHFSWGKFIIRGREHSETPDDQVGAGKDIRLIGEEVSEWRERKGHRLKKSMITGVYDQDVEVLIIGTGVYGSLKCPKKVQESVRQHGVLQLILETTPRACRIYNDLYRRGERLALLAHGTC